MASGPGAGGMRHPGLEEAEKAVGASADTLLIPNPPSLTGKVAWDQAASSRTQLEMVDKDSLKMESKASSRGLPKQGEHRRR